MTSVSSVQSPDSVETAPSMTLGIPAEAKKGESLGRGKP